MKRVENGTNRNNRRKNHEQLAKKGSHRNWKGNATVWILLLELEK
jgi:hypothetical protein